MAFQFIDHEGRRAEHFIMSGSGGLALVAFDPPIPAFQFQSHVRRIVIFQWNEGGEGEHRGADGNALPCHIARMGIDGLIEHKAGANEFFTGWRFGGIRIPEA